MTPSSGGVFEVMIDDRLIYSKKETGRHGEPDEILRDARKVIRG